MIGKNELRINHETMRSAMNLWLAATFKNPPRAVSVVRDNSSGGMDHFIVKLGEPDDKTEAS